MLPVQAYGNITRTYRHQVNIDVCYTPPCSKTEMDVFNQGAPSQDSACLPCKVVSGQTAGAWRPC